METKKKLHTAGKIMFIPLLVFIVYSCKSLPEKVKDTTYIISHDSIYVYHNGSFNIKPEISGIMSTGNFAFIVKDKFSRFINGRDTVSYTSVDGNEYNDSSYYENCFHLYLNEPITYNQLIHFLKINRIPNNKINEHLYWLSKLTNAHLNTVKNRYGDIDGYFVESSNGDFIPKDYFELVERSEFDDQVIFISEEIEFARDEIHNNYISFSFVIAKKSRFAEPRFPIESFEFTKLDSTLSHKYLDNKKIKSKKKKYDNKLVAGGEYYRFTSPFNYLTEIELHNQGLKSLPVNGYAIGLLVEVRSRMYFHTNFSNRLNYLAYDIYNLEKLMESK